MIVKCAECVYAVEGFCLINPPCFSPYNGDFPEQRWGHPRTAQIGCGQGKQLLAPFSAADCDRWRDSKTESFPTSGKFRIAIAERDVVCFIVDGQVRITSIDGVNLMTRENISALMEGLAQSRFWRPAHASTADREA